MINRRHSWCCKSKVEYNQETTANVNPMMEMPAQECLLVKSCKAIKCCCGKVCKGPRGLKSEVFDTLTGILNEINELLLHPRNKIRLCSQYALPKISWHFTVSDIGKTWVNEMLDAVASKYIRKWLELPISATLSNILLPYNRFGLNIFLPSTKFLQCQTVSRKALQSSPNDDINKLWTETSNYKSIQYDTYKNTKDVLSTIRKQHEDKHHLIPQGSFFSNIIKYSTILFNSIWSPVQSKLPKGIYSTSLYAI